MLLKCLFMGFFGRLSLSDIFLFVTIYLILHL
nr:MAG TPA: hypothetical protein [Caudoviricetes sp.]